MNITEYTVEQIKDPTGILQGDRFEFFLTIEWDEEDELAAEENLQLKVLFYIDEKESKILDYHFYNSLDNKYLDFGLEDEELLELNTFCNKHYMEQEVEE
ncbi:DUF6509 family protein [Bacillus sp. B1-b2]|uniref:DUF6509 family protein n=1 Tax=Bacillus sp. B1-b2 TaxID=2653201 RepID=UPI00126159C2|nr:DUF6509 family protein [Bacillus sp. B1-b2]KAB7673065.1 pullulanase [Bacillus sp. B1-b2]